MNTIKIRKMLYKNSLSYTINVDIISHKNCIIEVHDCTTLMQWLLKKKRYALIPENPVMSRDKALRKASKFKLYS
jgi:hypothetical protein